MAGAVMNVAGALIQAPLRAVPLATLLLVNHVVPKPVKGVLRFVLLLGQQKVRRLAGSALRLEQLPLMGPVAVVVDILAGPAAVLAFGRPVLRTLAPPVWRMASFYGHMLPLLFGYFKTIFIEIPKAEKGGASDDETQEIWDARHEIGSGQMMGLMSDLKGFFLKIGQVFATKADVLPPAYPRKLKALFDACPPTPYRSIKRTLERELGRPLEELFATFDPEPLATATIAQVHVAYLHDGRKVAVKVQHENVESLMRQDIGNSLVIARLLDALKIDCYIDQVSFLEEYRKVVPTEFDFVRERDLLELIRTSLTSSGCPARVVLPESVPSHCTVRVLTETFVEGTGLSKLQHQIELHEESWDLDPPPGASPAEMHNTVKELLEAFGHMIFDIGVFHSDPHPGNIVVMKDGAVGLLDFGEVKELDDETRLLYAKLCIALARRDQEVTLCLADQAGLEITGVPDEFKCAAVHVLFDTNMDMEAARMSPFDADCPKDLRMPVIPRELVMILRTCTIIRGILARFNCDVSAARVWEPYARRALARAGIEAPLPEKTAAEEAAEAEEQEGRAASGGDAGAGPASEAGADGAGGVSVGGAWVHPLLLQPKGGSAGTVYDKMFRLATWMREAGLPHDRRALTPMAMGSVYGLADIAALETDKAVDAVFKKFPPADRQRCIELAREAMELHRKADAAADTAAAWERPVTAEAAGRSLAPAAAESAAYGEAADDSGLLCSRPVRDEAAWRPSSKMNRVFASSAASKGAAAAPSAPRAVAMNGGHR